MTPSEKFLVTGRLTLVALAVPDVQQGRNTPFSSGSQPCRTSLRVLGDTGFEGSSGGARAGKITRARNTGQRNTGDESSVKRPKSRKHREFFRFFPPLVARTIMP
ncbi:hypothetical protein C8J57DRAFT_1404352 [Mycena rebaudengoi]|nr:hypothetical protein C8J57DRAFT_1404352 [Mycena rebaudengoi]